MLLVVFLGFVLFKFLQGGYRFPLLGALRFEFLVGAFLTLASIVLIAGRKQSLPKTSLYTWASLLLLILMIMVPLSIVPVVSWEIFVDRVAKFALVGVFIVAFVTSPRYLKLFLFVYLLAFLKMTQEGLHGIITGDLIWENQGIPRLHGPTPGYQHPNSFAGTQLSMVPFLFALIPLASRIPKIVLIGQLIGSAFITMYTGSRTAYVAAFAWIAYMVRTSRRSIRVGLLVLVLSLVAVPFIPDEYVGRFNTILEQEDKEGASIDMRKEILRDAWAIFLDNPMGLGVGAFPAERSRRFGRDQDTHNLYLEVATNIGIHGLVVFLGFVLSIYVGARRVQAACENMTARLREILVHPRLTLITRIQLEKEQKNVALISATAAAICGFLVIRLTLGMFGMDLYEIYWWFSCGLTIALLGLIQSVSARIEALAALGIRPPDEDDTWTAE